LRKVIHRKAYDISKKHEIVLRLTDSAFPYVFISCDDEQLTLNYGFQYSEARRTIAMTEDIPFADYPELKGIHDGLGWNLTELFCLFDWEGHALTLKTRIKAQSQEQAFALRPIADETTQQVYAFIVAYFEEYGWAPTIAEIAKGCFIAQGSVEKHLTTL